MAPVRNRLPTPLPFPSPCEERTMTSHSWLRQPSALSSRHRPAPVRRPARRRPHLETLEDRLAPALLTVTTNADDSLLAQDSLRAAISSIEHGADANTNIQRTGPYGTNDTIQFNLPPGQLTMDLTSHD